VVTKLWEELSERGFIELEYPEALAAAAVRLEDCATRFLYVLPTEAKQNLHKVSRY